MFKNYHVTLVFMAFAPYNPNHNSEAIYNPNHNPIPNPSPKQSNVCLTSLSRDQNSFLRVLTFQGSRFTENAYSNTDYSYTLLVLLEYIRRTQIYNSNCMLISF